jgi:hypothetical protein
MPREEKPFTVEDLDALDSLFGDGQTDAPVPVGMPDGLAGLFEQ